MLDTYLQKKYKTDLTIVIKQGSNKSIFLIQKIAKQYIIPEKDLENMYVFFSQLYDELYHDLLLKRIKIEKRVLRILEVLASPIHQKSFPEQQQFFKKLFSKK